MMSKIVSYNKIASKIHAIVLFSMAATIIMATWMISSHGFILEYFLSFHFTYGVIFASSAIALGTIQWQRHSGSMWYCVLAWYVSLLITLRFYLGTVAT